MTTAERANELIVKFLPYTTFRNDGGYDPEVSIDNAKQCAIIHIDGVLEVLGMAEVLADRKLAEEFEAIKSAIQNL